MTCELQSTLEASGIEWPALRNHIPCMAHIIQLALGPFMSSLGEKGRTKSWEAHEHDRDLQFGENESVHIGKSQKLRKEGNARINKVSAMKPGLAKIIEKVCISRYFESAETDHHIAENACCIDYANTWSSKRVHWLSKNWGSASRYIRFEIGRPVETLPWSCSIVPSDYVNSHTSGLKIQNRAITGQSSQLEMNGPLWSMSWKCWGHSDIGPCGCRRGIQSHCIMWSQSTMICSITWMASCELWLRKRLPGTKTCCLPWS